MIWLLESPRPSGGIREGYKDSVHDIVALPLKLDPLQKRLLKKLPFLPVKRREVPVDPSVQSTRLGQLPLTPLMKWHYWYEPVSLFKDILRFRGVTTPQLTNQHTPIALSEIENQSANIPVNRIASLCHAKLFFASAYETYLDTINLTQLYQLQNIYSVPVSQAAAKKPLFERKAPIISPGQVLTR